MFVRVEPNHLVKRTQYIIVEDGCTYIARFVKEVFIGGELYLMFSNTETLYFSLNCDFYQFV